MNRFYKLIHIRSFQSFRLLVGWGWGSHCKYAVSLTSFGNPIVKIDKTLDTLMTVFFKNHITILSYQNKKFHVCYRDEISFKLSYIQNRISYRWVGLWGFLWWAPSAKRKDHHGVCSGWSSVWHRSNTGQSSTQYEQIPIILGVWPFWLTPFFFWSITFWRAYG